MPTCMSITFYTYLDASPHPCGGFDCVPHLLTEQQPLLASALPITHILAVLLLKMGPNERSLFRCFVLWPVRNEAEVTSRQKLTSTIVGANIEYCILKTTCVLPHPWQHFLKKEILDRGCVMMRVLGDASVHDCNFWLQTMLLEGRRNLGSA